MSGERIAIGDLGFRPVLDFLNEKAHATPAVNDRAAVLEPETVEPAWLQGSRAISGAPLPSAKIEVFGPPSSAQPPERDRTSNRQTTTHPPSAPMAAAPDPFAGPVHAHGVGRAPTTTAWKPAPMQPGQFELRTRSYAPWAHFGGGFEGDKRGLTAHLDVTSRMTNKTLLDTRDWKGIGGVSVAGSSAYCDVSRWELYRDQASNPYGRAVPRAHVESRNWGPYNEIQTRLAGKNGAAPIAADLDLDTDVTVMRRGNLLRVTGSMSGDAFPNAEVLLTDASGQTVLVHHFETEGNFMWLVGEDHEGMGRFAMDIVLDDDGNFAGVRRYGSDEVYSVRDWNADVMAAQE